MSGLQEFCDEILARWQKTCPRNRTPALRDYDKDDRSTWPEKVRMSGLPFLLQGWNSTYYLYGEQEGHPIYHLDPYLLYWIVPIIGTRICVSGGRWIMERHCDPVGFSYLVKDWDFTEDGPVGEWSSGARVSLVP